MVLVVDDNLTLRWLFVQQLEKLACKCECAANGTEAVICFERNHYYRLVLMDVMMPGLDGLEATKQIRRLEQAEHRQHVPIVAMTCVEDRQACLLAGMDDYYLKPVLPEHLKEIVDKWCPEHR